MTRPILLFALVASAIGLFWYAMGRPSPVPASPLAEGQKLNCLSYAPFHGSQAPFDQPLRIADEQIESDLKQLAQVTSCIRTYSSARAQGKITRVADKLGLKVLQGIWIGRNLADNRREIEAALRLARRHPGVIEAFIVGNETLLRGELGADRIKTYLEEVRRRSGPARHLCRRLGVLAEGARARSCRRFRHHPHPALLGGRAGRGDGGRRACARDAGEGGEDFCREGDSGSARWAGRARAACATARSPLRPIRRWC